jgi:hypothetical protein
MALEEPSGAHARVWSSVRAVPDRLNRLGWTSVVRGIGRLVAC